LRDRTHRQGQTGTKLVAIEQALVDVKIEETAAAAQMVVAGSIRNSGPTSFLRRRRLRRQAFGNHLIAIFPVTGERFVAAHPGRTITALKRGSRHSAAEAHGATSRSVSGRPKSPYPSLHRQEGRLRLFERGDLQ
jgi:hypothetical protein